MCARRSPISHCRSLQVYDEPLYRRHYAGIFAVATLFRVLLLLGSIGASLVISYSSGGFWVKIKPTFDQAKVHYTGDVLLVFDVSVTCITGTYMA